MTITLRRSLSPMFWLLLCLIVFTACLGGGSGETAVTGDTTNFPQGTQATLVCNASCSQWAQCGAKADGTGDVVLAGQGGPTVINHELFFPASTPITVDGQELRTLNPSSGGEAINMNFYYVITTDNTKGGWVAGWCVQAASN